MTTGTLHSTTARLVGVDAARGLALLGMMATHVFPLQGPDGGTSLWHHVFSGRASATFAVLAGVGLALLTGGAEPRVDARVRGSVLVRAVLIALVGLLLGALESGVAVILVYYGVYFALAVPLLGLRARPLAGAAALLLVGGPLLGWALRAVPGLLPERVAGNPALSSPVDALLSTVLVTGYYPALSWLGYLCAGLAVGRLALREPRVQAAVLGGGVVLAVAASLVSALLLGPLGGAAAVRAVEGADVDLTGNQFGDVPTSTAWWLAVDASHATTPPDLLHTTGSALAVLGALLLLGRATGPLLRPLAALGAMPLTLYSVHVVVLAATDGDDPLLLWAVQAVLFTAFAVAWSTAFRRGPLEAVVAAASGRGDGRARG